MQKLKLQTANMAERNIEMLGQMFPNCLTETINGDGKLVRAIDFDKLRQELACEVAEGAEERYQFTWPDKRAAIRLANAPTNKTLRPCREESVDFDNTENLYIEGDNLEVLKLLRENYLGKVKMIYIDPPYNTGNDFVYNDDFAQGKAEFEAQSGLFDEEGRRMADPMVQNTESNGRFHTDWLNMIYPRLKVAKDLLTDNGIILISIDEHESHNLKKICDEIFGEANYFGDLIWESTTQPANTGGAKFGLQQKTEVILFYGKNKSAILGFNLEIGDTTLTYPHIGKFGKCRFEVIEKSDAGGYSRPTMKFKILGQYPREGKRWQIGEEKARELERTGKVEIIDGIVKKAVYPEDESDKIQYKPFWSLIRESKLLTSENGTALNGKEEVNTLFECPLGFDTVKPSKLLKKLIFHITNQDAIILDFFSGTATTAHAVMQLNAEDGGNRKFIMVQLPELTDEKSDAYRAGYKNICEIGKERIRRAGRKIKEENASKEGIERLDVGFRVLKLDESNMADVYYTPADTPIQTTLAFDALVDNIREGRTAEDLLFQVLPECNLPLSSKIEEREIHGKKVFVVEDGYLMACFDKNINESVITAIAKEKPYYFVMCDRSMETDNVADNFEQIFEAYSKETVRRIL